MNEQHLIRMAYDEGFAAAAVVDTAQIPVDPMFRPYCEENLCGKYGVNYTCPPDCGSPEEMHQKLLERSHALVLQTIWEIEDYSDREATGRAKAAHNAATRRLAKKLRAEGVQGFLVGSSGCSLCDPCEIMNGKPCRFPDMAASCMSAYCIFVRELTEKCGIEYDCGAGLLALFGMYVFDDPEGKA